LVIGLKANLTCINDVGIASLIHWQSENGIVLASASSTNVLNLPLAPVNDSGSLHNRIFTCLVTRNSIIFNQTTSVKVYGMFRGRGTSLLHYVESLENLNKIVSLDR